MSYGKFKNVSYKVHNVVVDRDAVGIMLADEVLHPWIKTLDINLIEALCEFEEQQLED